MKHGLKVLIEHYKSKEHWYIKYLIWGVGIIVFCAILVHVFKELGYTPARKIFGFFDDWALVLSAAATLLLAFTAFWAIMDNRYGRKVDRKERLLNEIVEWAEDILVCGRVPDMLYEIRMKDAKRIDDLRGIIAEDASYRFNPIKVRSQYIGKIVLRFEEDLQNAVKSTTKELNRQSELLKQVRDGEINPKIVGEQRKGLDQSANKVIEEAAKIKTKDASL